jgi:hypothetical protein
MLFLGPLFVYGTVIDPWAVRNELPRFFRSDHDVVLVLILNLASVVALVCGTLHRHRGCHIRRGVKTVSKTGERSQLQRAALVLVLVSLAAYAYGIANVGGFTAAFSRAKGGGSAGSGYINEAMNLGLVAGAMVSLSRLRMGWDAAMRGMVVLGLLPNLLQGTFGGRRGPLFLALTSLVVSWLVVRRKAPRVWMMGTALAVVVLSVGFVWSQRQFLHLGSERAEVDWESFWSTLAVGDTTEGNNFIYGAGFVVATHNAQKFTWGREALVTLVVRPIPRQLWPTKYKDVGAEWITNEYPGLGHLEPTDWLSAVGWLPLTGSAASSIADLFGEFSWGAVIVMYLIGRGFAELRVRRTAKGGMWVLLYIEALVLTVYLATQSFEAFYYRFLILAVPTVIIWRTILSPGGRGRRPLYRLHLGAAVRTTGNGLRVPHQASQPDV